MTTTKDQKIADLDKADAATARRVVSIITNTAEERVEALEPTAYRLVLEALTEQREKLRADHDRRTLHAALSRLGGFNERA